MINPGLQSAGVDTLRDHLRALRSDTLPLAAMARGSGVAESVLAGWLNNSCDGDQAKVTAKVRRWLDTRGWAPQAPSALPPAPGFVIMPTAEKILAALAYAQHAPTMAVISGGAGIGKTYAIEHYARSNPNVWILTGEPSVKSPATVLSYLADVLAVNERSCDRRSRAIVERLRDTAGLLIVDEAHHYPTLVLEQLRYVFDQSRIGLALLGNLGIYTRLEGEGRSQKHAPLFRRIGMRLTLPRPRTQDIAALLDAWGTEGREERRLLGLIGGRLGALGSMTMVLRMAHMLSAGQSISAAHIDAAHRQLTELSVEGSA
jgi:DNA transposition AAA+ family ATPase